MKSAKFFNGHPGEKSGESIFQSNGKYFEVGQHSSEDDLDTIRVGTRISSVEGKKGVVADIEVLRRHGEVQYYFRLEKSAGTILIIK